MSELLIIVFTLFYITVLNAERQFYDDEHPCLSDDSTCYDDGRVFRDDETMDEEPILIEDLFDAPSPEPWEDNEAAS